MSKKDLDEEPKIPVEMIMRRKNFTLPPIHIKWRVLITIHFFNFMFRLFRMIFGLKLCLKLQDSSTKTFLDVSQQNSSSVQSLMTFSV